jgi:hypothetical protein
MLSHPDCRAFLTLIAAHHPGKLNVKSALLRSLSMLIRCPGLVLDRIVDLLA